MNLREQHDAFEFFNCLVDSLDEGLKSFSYNPVLSEVLGGAFADQKICKGCPHRLERPQLIPFLGCMHRENLIRKTVVYTTAVVALCA